LHSIRLKKGVEGGAAQVRDVVAVLDRAGSRRFRAAGRAPYRKDPNWVPPLPGEERAAFDPRRNPSLEGVEAQRWILLEGGAPAGRIAAFAPGHRPGVGYIGFFEAPDDPAAARSLLRTAETWLASRGCRECFGPISVTPRDRIGLLIDGFQSPPLLFTPYNPPYYRALLESAGWAPRIFLRAYGWGADYADPAGVRSLAHRGEAGSSVSIRALRPKRLKEEVRLISGLINEALAGAWHFDPIGERESSQLARLLRPIIDPSMILIAEDGLGACGVALTVPDVNWLWHRSGGKLISFGWMLLRHRRQVPQVRLMALCVARRVRGSGVMARLVSHINDTGQVRGYLSAELSQVYEDHVMSRTLERMRLPVVRRYAVFARRLGD